MGLLSAPSLYSFENDFFVVLSNNKKEKNFFSRSEKSEDIPHHQSEHPLGQMSASYQPTTSETKRREIIDTKLRSDSEKSQKITF